MAQSQKSENVPKAMEAKFNSIIELTNEFAQQHLNEEYAQLIRQATAALCRKRPSPLEKGQAKTWAAGITHAIGMVNFLFDSSRAPYISAGDLYQWFGISASTGQGKSKQVRDTLKMYQFDPNWCLPSLIDRNPLIWMLSVNGLIIDIRSAPLQIQVDAFQRGMIPYIPGHQEDSEAFVEKITGKASQPSSEPQSSSEPQPTSKTKTPKGKTKSASAANSPEALKALYVLEVVIIAGPITNEFLEKNPEIVRTIEIRGDQTLTDLHKIIFKAFNRFDHHLYEFQLKGKRPNDPNADRYVMAMAMDDEFGKAPAGDVAKTQIGALGLEVDELFGYWFDFGDDWWHQIRVLALAEPKPKVKYPRITHRIGASPPQYADFD